MLMPDCMFEAGFNPLDISTQKTSPITLSVQVCMLPCDDMVTTVFADHWWTSLIEARAWHDMCPGGGGGDWCGGGLQQVQNKHMQLVVLCSLDVAAIFDHVSSL